MYLDLMMTAVHVNQLRIPICTRLVFVSPVMVGWWVMGTDVFKATARPSWLLVALNMSRPLNHDRDANTSVE